MCWTLTDLLACEGTLSTCVTTDDHQLSSAVPTVVSKKTYIRGWREFLFYRVARCRLNRFPITSPVPDNTIHSQANCRASNDCIHGCPYPQLLSRHSNGKQQTMLTSVKQRRSYRGQPPSLAASVTATGLVRVVA